MKTCVRSCPALDHTVHIASGNAFATHHPTCTPGQARVSTQAVHSQVFSCLPHLQIKEEEFDYTDCVRRVSSSEPPPSGPQTCSDLLKSNSCESLPLALTSPQVLWYFVCRPLMLTVPRFVPCSVHRRQHPEFSLRVCYRCAALRIFRQDHIHLLWPRKFLPGGDCLRCSIL